MPGYFDDLADVFQAANVYVHPLQEDSSCRCLKRALAAGLCAIATQSRSAENLIEKNVNGLLAPKCNPEALAEAIRFALNESDLRDRVGRKARQLALERFDVTNLAPEFVAPFMATAECDTQSAT
jgi:glycosyltransferase involved in cell wall biosynthesis